MRALWIFFPPWVYAVVVTWLGRWGESRWIRHHGADRSVPVHERVWRTSGSVIITNLFFLSLLPTTLLVWTRGMLPVEGPRAGLALALAAFAFGCVPSRLLDVGRLGWDRTLWGLFVDLVRVGGALLLIGWLIGV
ncbi:MAG TPA: hypothetical protein VM118_14095 [Acidobacteriota bacterium]|nr:hypothetical protein [Acidobacteriota bacterium]